MKLGIITDIHEHVEFLRIALDRFEREQVDQVVFVGDIFLMGEQIEETCRLLSEASVIGVWGNHDFGLCVDPDDELREKYAVGVIEYMSSLQPGVRISGCHFCHIEPWLNPEILSDLWYFEGPPDEHGKLARIFDAVPDRVLFAGHYHKWLLATRDGICDWHGDCPIHLPHDDRFFVVVGALCEGRYAVFDTNESMLIPFNET